jgi:hypothetical protein
LGVIVIGLATGVLAARSGLPLSSRTVTMSAVKLLLISLMLAVMTGASEAFAYPAPWHFVGAFTLVWATALAGSVAAGSVVASRRGELAPFLLAGSALIVLVLGFVAAADLTQQIEKRFDGWNRGPAWIAGVADIYTPAYYTTQCWHTLGRFRDLPPRPYEYPYVLPARP